MIVFMVYTALRNKGDNFPGNENEEYYKMDEADSNHILRFARSISSSGIVIASIYTPRMTQHGIR